MNKDFTIKNKNDYFVFLIELMFYSTTKLSLGNSKVPDAQCSTLSMDCGSHLTRCIVAIKKHLLLLWRSLKKAL